MSNESYIQQLFAERIGGAHYGKSNTIYKFEKIKRAKAAAKAQNPATLLIDMGVGEPDQMAFPQVVQSLQQAAADPANRGYADNGGAEFKQAVARYMERVFGVTLDPATQVVHSIGSKAALSILPTCFINPNDIVLMTSPGYPVFGTHAQYYGATVYNLSLRPENNFLPDLQSIPDEVLHQAKVLVLNYPNNPTGASASIEFFKQAIAFAKKHHLLLIQDAAYSALVFKGRPLSILAIEGAKEVALELHSLSKGFNMTGWRIGWVCGNALAVRAYADVKDNCDSGQFLAIQKAAAVALDNPQITEAIASRYSQRMDMLVPILQAAGFTIHKPNAGFFLYTKAPTAATTTDGRHIAFETAEDFSQFLIRELLISTVPWDEAGAFVRFSVTFAAESKEDEAVVIKEITRRLATCKLHF